MKPVLFNYQEAKRLVTHYDFLKGKKIKVNNSEYVIEHILITPYEKERFGVFLDKYILFRDNDRALAESGFNSNRLQIILMEGDLGGATIWAELDSYLTKNNIAKVYDIDLTAE